MSLRSLFMKRQRRACRRKERIPNVKMARQAARSASKRDGAAMEFYVCERCGAYHIGHPSLLADTVRGKQRATA